MKISLKTKLDISFLFVVCTIGILSTWVGIWLIGNRIVSQAQNKVRIDLNSARVIYQDVIDDIECIVHFTSFRHCIKNYITGAFEQRDRETLRMILEKVQKEANLDIIAITDENGIVLLRARNPKVYGDSQADDEMVKLVLEQKRVISGTTLINKEKLEKEGEDLLKQAHIEIIPTPKAKPTNKKEETSGMMIKAAAPIVDDDGSLLGIIYAGKLLNRNYKIVDKIKNTVYQGEIYKGKEIGTATIFQGDLRISTNVERENGTRAIGTRVSEEVYNRVLLDGLSWIDRAFVVNNWYITAYEPIKNIKDEIIGIIYVGMLEEKFVDMKKSTMWTFLGITFAGIVCVMVISYFLGNGILKPIEELVHAAHQWAKGNLSHRVEVSSKDELGELVDTFNMMASSLKERNERLKQVQDQIIQCEKLAGLGRLAAGVAHEINNPLGSILVYSHLLLEDMDEDAPEKENIKKIIHQTTRCKDIVKDLLELSRQDRPRIEPISVNNILGSLISLFESQALFQNIEIVQNFEDELPNIMADFSRLEQVFMNIILNAAEAMKGKGKLNISTYKSEDGKHIKIEFADTGPGISEEEQNKVFEPFYTTKEAGKGTGLGLAVSYGIIQKHNGTIEIDSQVGVGTTFIITLPINHSS